MFNRKIKKENELLKEKVKLYKDLYEEVSKKVKLYKDLHEETSKEYNSLYRETKDVFTYNDAMEILTARLEYMEDKYNEVKGSGLVEATQRYYYQKTELEKIIWVLMEKGKQKDKKITKHTFKKMVVSDE